MQSFVYKRYKKKKNSVYYAQFRVTKGGPVQRLSMDTTDRDVANQKMRRMIREGQLEGENMIAPKAIREAEGKPLSKHLADFAKDRSALGRNDRYLYELKNRVARLMRECGWMTVGKISADSFQKWRSGQTMSPKTVNEHLTSIRALLNWMERNGRLSANPLKRVEKTPQIEQVRPRRALTNDEIIRLLNVADDYAITYLTALYTGLRRGELEDIRCMDLNAKSLSIHLMASSTKNRKSVDVPVPAELIEKLAIICVGRAAIAYVFDHRMPTMWRFKHHLKLANIPFVDDRGRRVDFHSLRHTFCTQLQLTGATQRVAMSLMRHTDAKLTHGTYTDANQLPLRQAINKLSYSSESLANDGTQISTHKGDEKCPDVARSGISRIKSKSVNLPTTKEVRLTLAEIVAMRRAPKNCAVQGSNLSARSSSDNALFSLSTQTSTQNFLILEKAWPLLSASAQDAILNVLDLAAKGVL